MPRRPFRLRFILAAAHILAAATAIGSPADTWLGLMSPALHDIVQRQALAERELSSLGTPVVGQTVPQFGYQHPRLAAAPPTSPWVQVDLQSSQAIDWIALAPAQLDWQSVDHAAYGFPPRFRVDISDDPNFATFTPVAVFTDTDFPDPGIAPVALPVGGRRARYVRVTVTKLSVENGQHFFALAELMVVAGARNLAIGRPVTASATVDLPPRWSTANLVDGRTPLGPPVQRELLAYDGLYVGPTEDGTSPWMRLDLGHRVPIQEIRLHPVHARLGADIPGFAFPARFRVEAADEPTFAHPTILFDASAADYPNPGNNPVTIPVANLSARYVQVVMLAPGGGIQMKRYGLSEIEVYSDGINVARTATATAVPDPYERSKNWPVSQLIDGFTSYGRLIELPEWLSSWQHRATLQTQLSHLAGERAILEPTVRRRALWFSAGAALLAFLIIGFYLAALRRRRERELERFRTRLAHDLHDEIGSNLAGLAMLSETAADSAAPSSTPREDWLEVNRVARESTDAMREVLWLVGAREESGIDLAAHLRLAATRVLPGRDVRWSSQAEALPAQWSADTRRQLFLFFKETLANIARHSQATAIELSLHRVEHSIELLVGDNGRGFDLLAVNRGVGLHSLRERARTLGGTCSIDTAPGRGTRVTLRVPVSAR
jgi:signal transduction histidine kinase